MSFRAKLLLSMMLMVGAITAATLLATQQKVQAAYEQMFDEQFQNQIAYFANMQQVRLSNVREKSLSFAKSVRVVAAMNEYLSQKSPETIDDLYLNLRNELLRPTSEVAQRRGEGASFYRFLDDHGKVIPPVTNAPSRRDGAASGSERRSPPEVRAGRPPPRGGRFMPFGGSKELEAQLTALAKAMEGKEQQQVGYLAPITDSSKSRLHEVVLTKIVDPTENDRVLGALVLGFEVSNAAEDTLIGMSQIQSGVFLDGEIYSHSIPESTRAGLEERIAAELRNAREGRFELTITDRPHTVLFRALNAASEFPAAYQVCVYSLDEPVRVQRDLRLKILLFGGLAMLAALAVSLVLSHGLSVPIHQLVDGTRAVEKGNFNVRVPVRPKDALELVELAQSFNQMTAGLALKEKYRSVLDMVADKRIADDLIHGKIALGGEERDIAVLFCDIRGFTALTQNMDPPEVIQMLNEHFTPLTKVVYEHHGVVDKFVGDLIMAIFGAPTSHGNDPLLAAQCALRMIEERTKLNDTSKYKIAVGIGVAAGKAVAGRMGSEDRLNYTVLGPRVNLASRLCGQAGKMEVVIDETTHAICKDFATVEPMPPMKLKGFSEPIQAFKLLALRKS